MIQIVLLQSPVFLAGGCYAIENSFLLMNSLSVKDSCFVRFGVDSNQDSSGDYKGFMFCSFWG